MSICFEAVKSSEGDIVAILFVHCCSVFGVVPNVEFRIGLNLYESSAFNVNCALYATNDIASVGNTYLNFKGCTCSNAFRTLKLCKWE